MAPSEYLDPARWLVFKDDHLGRPIFLIGTVSRRTESNVWLDGFEVGEHSIDGVWARSPVQHRKVGGQPLEMGVEGRFTWRPVSYETEHDAIKAVIGYLKKVEEEAVARRLEVSKLFLKASLDKLAPKE